jgi:hypothetical protein
MGIEGFLCRFYDFGCDALHAYLHDRIQGIGQPDQIGSLFACNHIITSSI